MATDDQPKELDPQFKKLIFPLELEQIAQRREQIAKRQELTGASKSKLAERAGGLSPVAFGKTNHRSRFKKDGERKAVPPSTDLDLIGLALSGGGIRSATFNLGVVQALAEHGIVEQVDYLSTVSGGGYFGGCLSAVLNKATDAKQAIGEKDNGTLTFGSDDKGEEHKVVKHLRNNSKYLAPRGLLNIIRIPALVLREIVIHFLVILPYLLVAVWLTDTVWGDSLREAAQVGTIRSHFHYAAIAAVFFAACAVLSILVQVGSFQKSFKWRDRFEGTFGCLLLLFVLVALLSATLTALSAYHYFVHIAPGAQANNADAVRDFPWAVLGAIVPFLFAGKAVQNVSKLRGMLTLIVLGLLIPLILLAIYLFLADIVVFHTPQNIQPYIGGPTSLYWPPYLTGAFGIWLFTLLFVDVNKTSLHSFYRDRLSKAYLQVDHKGDHVAENDTLKLSGLNAKDALAPYHLINATLNLPASDDPDLRGRNADFFCSANMPSEVGVRVTARPKTSKRSTVASIWTRR